MGCLTVNVWFRPEVVQTVSWGGNPNKLVEVLDNGEVRMSPRKSFAAWQETVRGQSLPWKACEIEAALELRSAIVGRVLRKADELAKLNVELERSNDELDSFAYLAFQNIILTISFGSLSDYMEPRNMGVERVQD
jgi:light-regulated signal transduction histidine kinase (bacteriophytochrome)